MIKYTEKPSSIDELLKEHRENNCVISTAKLKFNGVQGFDVYNICQEFEWNGKFYIAGRVEMRDSEISTVRLFEKVGKFEYNATDVVFKMLQDPCQCVIGNELIIGGTKIYQNSNGVIDNWNTSFYKGTDINDMNLFAVAPQKMKDVRLFKTDKIHIFSRPQGGDAKQGRIGYTTCDKLTDITAEHIEKAELLTTQFTDGCWGGVNQIHLLKNGLLGIVGHIATMSEGNVRHYYGMVFCLNPETKKSTKVKIICERRDFKEGMYKRKDLIDVVFSGGLVRNEDGTAHLYTGLSDAEAHIAKIIDPFTEYEVGAK